jgi:hypothetical protein
MPAGLTIVTSRQDDSPAARARSARSSHARARVRWTHLNRKHRLVALKAVQPPSRHRFRTRRQRYGFHGVYGKDRSGEMAGPLAEQYLVIGSALRQ